MSKFLSKRLSVLESYTPGEQPQDRAYVKLNTNESPYPPSEGVARAIDKSEIDNLRLYCDPEAKSLRRALAEYYSVGQRQVFLSNGSDDILNFAFMAYGERGAAFADITYGFYEVFAALHGIQVDIIPLKEDFTLDKAAFTNRSGLVVIANPNAPTGIALSRCEIEEIVLANPNAVVLVDEAYVDFGAESAVCLTQKYDNLLCVGTFSKSRSMAGARLGFAIACEGLISDLEKIKYSTNPYNVNRLTQIAGRVAIEESGYYERNAARIIETREKTREALLSLGFFTLASKANFLFAKSDKISGEELYRRLKEKGVLIRHFSKERIKDFNRITIGSPEDMQIFIDKTKEILEEIGDKK